MINWLVLKYFSTAKNDYLIEIVLIVAPCFRENWTTNIISKEVSLRSLSSLWVLSL